GKPVFYGIQAGEKTYADFTLTVTNPGGHSSRPSKPNAIDQLARALVRIGDYEFSVMANELTREYFEASAPNTPSGRRSDEALRRKSERCRCDRNAIRRSGICRPATNDVRTDDAVRRPCGECVATARDRQRELSDLPWHVHRE